ncbi:hypothetical protein [Lucifera butyrica]|uniref:hypothetical protein n=1 Tax=Lucifera butyrica TaxID=1351585 RepID=UPI00140216CA|nr:hypothetical protein [Lucifera butyrica]
MPKQKKRQNSLLAAAPSGHYTAKFIAKFLKSAKNRKKAQTVLSHLPKRKVPALRKTAA